MLLIGSAGAKLLAKKLDNFEFNGVTFHVEKLEGLSLTVSHNAKDDKVAKAQIKEIVKTIPELKNYFLGIQIVDENGYLL